MPKNQPRPPSLDNVFKDLDLPQDVRDCYGEAIARSLKLWRADPPHFGALLAFVLEACEEARRWKGREDPSARLRHRDRDYLMNLLEAEKAIKTLRRFISRYPNLTDWAILSVITKVREEGLQLGWADRRTTRPAMMDRVLEALAGQLRDGTPHAAAPSPIACRRVR